MKLPGDAGIPIEEALDKVCDSVRCRVRAPARLAAGAPGGVGADSSPDDCRRGLGFARAASTCRIKCIMP